MYSSVLVATLFNKMFCLQSNTQTQSSKNTEMRLSNVSPKQFYVMWFGLSVSYFP